MTQRSQRHLREIRGQDSSGAGLQKPVITTLSPSTAARSTSFTLSVTGSSFVGGETILFGATVYSTNFISATQVDASTQVAAGATPGTVQVTVKRGAYVSNQKPFVVT